MKVFCIFSILCLAASNAHLIQSGNLQLSGSFQAHPLLRNHLANHRWFSKPAPADPVAFDNTVTESPVPITPIPVPVVEMVAVPAPAVSVQSNVDVQKLVNDLVGVKIGLWRHIQSGVNDRFDRHVQRLEKFSQHVNKPTAASGSASSANAGSVVTFDANISVNDGTRVAPAVAPADTFEAGFDSGSDFSIADSSLDAHKGDGLAGLSASGVPSCDH